MYKKILINMCYSGFFNAGFVSLSRVKKMDDCEEKDLLLNIFKYNIINNNEELEDAYEQFHADDYEYEEVIDKEKYIKKKDFYNLLSERSKNKDFDFLSSVCIESVFNKELEEVYISDMGEFEEVLRSIFSKKYLEDDFDEAEAYEKFENLEFDTENVLKIEAQFRDF